MGDCTFSFENIIFLISQLLSALLFFSFLYLKKFTTALLSNIVNKERGSSIGWAIWTFPTRTWHCCPCRFCPCIGDEGGQALGYVLTSACLWLLAALAQSYAGKVLMPLLLGPNLLDYPLFCLTTWGTCFTRTGERHQAFSKACLIQFVYVLQLSMITWVTCFSFP